MSVASPPSTYAQQRQSQRLFQLVALTGMLLFLSASLSLQLGGSIRPVCYAVMALALLNLVLFIIPWGGLSWSPVNDWQQPGSWLAMIPAIEHEAYNARGKATNPTLQLLGHAKFSADGFEWDLYGTYDGVRHVLWTSNWQLTARRSIGWIPRYELQLYDPKTAQTQTVCLIRSRGFTPR